LSADEKQRQLESQIGLWKKQNREKLKRENERDRERQKTSCV